VRGERIGGGKKGGDPFDCSGLTSPAWEAQAKKKYPAEAAKKKTARVEMSRNRKGKRAKGGAGASGWRSGMSKRVTRANLMHRTWKSLRVKIVAGEGWGGARTLKR